MKRDTISICLMQEALFNTIFGDKDTDEDTREAADLELSFNVLEKLTWGELLLALGL